MIAGKHLAVLGVTALVLAGLLLWFSEAYLLWMLLILLTAAALMALLLRHDAARLRLVLHAASGGQAGRPLAVTVSVTQPERFWVARYAVVELELRSVMFGTVERCRLRLTLRDGEARLETTVPAHLCGEMRICCTGVQVTDLLDTFAMRCALPGEERTVIYPQNIRMELELSQAIVGAASIEGLMQNRRGSDPSEIFDIREYMPGDDIRAIHWKLSCKTDTLILRQASDPSHYDVVLLPDLGLYQGQEAVTPEECNSAVAAVIALGEGLLRLGISFCMAVPTKRGLDLYEVRSLRGFHQLLPQWLGVEVCRQSGIGLQVFLTEHLEEHFTRLLIVSAGKYTQDVSGLNRRIGVTVVSTAQDADSVLHTALSASCEMVVLPSRPNRNELFRIVC